MNTTTNSIDSRATARTSTLDLETIRADFPILHQRVNGQPLVYLDNAATTQKPVIVIEAIASYYRSINANIHRGVHRLSQDATQAYEDARLKVQRFINAANWREIVFLRGTTEGINLVAQTWGRMNIKTGDEILISHMEHHSNIVPWQMLCEQTGAAIKIIPMDDRGDLLLDEFEKLISEKTKLVGVVHVSNALGTINPIKKVIDLAHASGAKVLIDGAQAAPHLALDVQSLDCDFYLFSGHKIFGPTGIGVLYGKEVLLDAMPPYHGGGNMIKSVTFEKTTYNDLPEKFEAGTPNIVGPIGLACAIDYIQQIGHEAIAAHERRLMNYATQVLQAIKGVRQIGTAEDKVGAMSFEVEGVHPHDVGTILDQMGVAIRTGHHCAQPTMDFFGVPATARASFSFYNTLQEIDKLAEAIGEVIEVFH